MLTRESLEENQIGVYAVALIFGEILGLVSSRIGGFSRTSGFFVISNSCLILFTEI